jgi:hypothetical protein
MTQVARPTADDQRGNWSPTPLSPHLNGVTANDGSPVVSGSNPPGDAFEVKLGGVALPGIGAQVLTVRLLGDGTTQVIVALLQGNQPIAYGVFTPTTTFQNYTLTLTADQIAQISDYTNLHVEVVAGNISTPCCVNSMPPVLTATFSAATGTCDCLDGVSVPLVWNVALGGWSGSAPACNGTLDFSFTCQSGNWYVQNTGGSCRLANQVLSGTCGVGQTQLSATTQVNGCCTGRVNITITG